MGLEIQVWKENAKTSPGIFEGRGLVHKKSTLKIFTEDTSLGRTFFRFSQKKYYRNFHNFVTFKFNDDYKQVL